MVTIFVSVSNVYTQASNDHCD